MSYKKSILILVGCLILSFGTAKAQSFSETKTIKQTFKAERGMSLNLKNKYGKVHVSPSENDSVYVSIEFKASASSSYKLNKLIKGVSYNLSILGSSLIVEPGFKTGTFNLRERIRSFTNNLISSESVMVVDCYVSIPSFITANIDNRYGDIYIESTGANFNVTASNGVLKTENLLGNNTFNLEFCNATFGFLKNSKINISYGDVKVENAETVNINSSSSKIYITNSKKVLAQSKRDKYFIKEIYNLEGTSYFSDFNIDLVNETLKLNTKYGNLNIDMISDDFELISAESHFTDIYLIMSEFASFELDAKLTKCTARVPKNWVLDETIISSDKEEYVYKGVIGPIKSNAKIILKLNKGKIDFKLTK